MHIITQDKKPEANGGPVNGGKQLYTVCFAAQGRQNLGQVLLTTSKATFEAVTDGEYLSSQHENCKHSFIDHLRYYFGAHWLVVDTSEQDSWYYS